jgi:hypothetical protein
MSPSHRRNIRRCKFYRRIEIWLLYSHVDHWWSMFNIKRERINWILSNGNRIQDYSLLNNCVVISCWHGNSKSYKSNMLIILILCTNFICIYLLMIQYDSIDDVAYCNSTRFLSFCFIYNVVKIVSDRMMNRNIVRKTIWTD